MPARTLLAFAAVLLAAAPALAQTANDTEASIDARLRQALRETTGQLRDAQNQLVALQAAQAQAEKDKAELQAKLDAASAQLKTVSDQAASDKATADKTIADLKQGSQTLVVHMVDALTTQINRLGKPDDRNTAELRQAVADWKAQYPDEAPALDRYGDDIQSWVIGYNEYVQLANETKAQRAQLAAQVPVLQRTVADREAKNLALYRLGGEILTRYERFGLGDAIGAKEPFTGLSRVKLENLVQGYKNALRDQAVIPEQPVAAISPAAPATTGGAHSP